MDDAAATGDWSPEEFGDEPTKSDPDTAVEQSFLLRLRDDPNDLAMRMVFADWLEQTAQLEKAEAVRLLAEVPVEGSPQTNRLRVLGTTLDRTWMAIVSRAPIERCDFVQFAFKCPKAWESLTSTDDPTVRFCNACSKHVYFCTTIQEVRMHGSARDCVAFSSLLRRAEALQEYDVGDLVEMGEVAGPWEPPTDDYLAGEDWDGDTDRH